MDWKVRHAFDGYERLSDEVRHGKSALLLPLKYRRMLPEFPAHLTQYSVNRNVVEREQALAGWLTDVLAVVARCEARGKHSVEALLESPALDAFFEMPFYSATGRIRRPVSRVGMEAKER